MKPSTILTAVLPAGVLFVIMAMLLNAEKQKTQACQAEQAALQAKFEAVSHLPCVSRVRTATIGTTVYTFGYDGITPEVGRLTSITSVPDVYGLTVAGPVATESYNGTVSGTYTLDASGTPISHSGTITYTSMPFSDDASPIRHYLTAIDEGADTHHIEYDGGNMVREYTLPNSDWSYTYTSDPNMLEPNYRLFQRSTCWPLKQYETTNPGSFFTHSYAYDTYHRVIRQYTTDSVGNKALSLTLTYYEN